MSVHVAWMSDAACSGMDTNIFYPSSSGVLGSREVERAKQICATCQVILECRIYARTASKGHGVWGGGARRHAASERQDAPIKHGTEGGYRAHVRRGVDPCAACRRAHNLSCQLRAERRKR